MMQKRTKILITAGPVWVPIDRVRVITNRFTGKTGFTIAMEAARREFKVTLLFGPGNVEIPSDIPGNLTIIRFVTYDDLYGLMESNIRSGEYAALIHTAAVPDYVPEQVFDGKIKSGRDELLLKLKSTVKIVDLVKKWDPGIILAKFKLEVGLPTDKLFEVARKSMDQSQADFIVANDLDDYAKQNRRAFIIDKKGNIMECSGNENIAVSLLELIGARIRDGGRP